MKITHRILNFFFRVLYPTPVFITDGSKKSLELKEFIIKTLQPMYNILNL